MKKETMKRLLLMTVALFAISAGSAKAVVVFEDDFESGSLWPNWLWVVGNYFTIDSTMNAIPSPGGEKSAYDNSPANRMYHSLGFELNGPSSFTVWIYDKLGIEESPVSATRPIAQVYAFTGPFSPVNLGLQQCLGIGKYNMVNMPGEVYNPNYYQGRVVSRPAGAGGGGWFNLDAPGAVMRSIGWHQFTIQREADNTTINYYVDGVLGRTITGARAATWDSVALGMGGGSPLLLRDAWFDGVQFTVTCPADITVNNDPGICGAQVTYTSPGGVQTAGLASGSIFPVGTTVNTFQFGEIATCSFTVTVVDNEPPTITAPDVTVPATSPAGATVTFSASAADNCSAELVCEPASGSLFPIGETTVYCAATDAAGNTATSSFTVRVKGAAEQIEDLIQLVRSFGLQRGIETSLLFQLRESAASLSRGQVPATCGTLQAFINYVSALTGIWLTPEQADLLIQEATRIRAVLDCVALGF